MAHAINICVQEKAEKGPGEAPGEAGKGPNALQFETAPERLHWGSGTGRDPGEAPERLTEALERPRRGLARPGEERPQKGP